MSLEFIIKLLVAFRKDQETGNIVGFCPNLGVYSQGENQKEAEEALKGAISLFAKHGGLDRILQEKGNKIELYPVGGTSEPIALSNFSSVMPLDLPAKFGRNEAGRGETCQPCA